MPIPSVKCSAAPAAIVCVGSDQEDTRHHIIVSLLQHPQHSSCCEVMITVSLSCTSNAVTARKMGCCFGFA